MMRTLKIEKANLSPEETKKFVEGYIKSIEKREKYETFRNRVYENLIEYKRKNITTDCGEYRGIVRDEFMPEAFLKGNVPAMTFPGIRSKVEEIQASEFKYKPHLFIFRHVASSQTACVNLFVPVLESGKADEILKSIDACPKDFDHIDRAELFNGYRFEFWDSTDEKSKGLLGDHSKQAGTDADVAIAYRNKNGELCLWLIEHKLTEQEFTTCGAYNSKGNTKEGRNNCRSCSLKEIMADHTICYYDRANHYNYWKIMADEKAKDFFSGEYDGKGCPFRQGMNQLWRNQMLAIALEKQGRYKSVSFSVVTHPENYFLDDSMQQYRKLINNSPKFSSFKSSEIICAAEKVNGLKEWVAWYKEVYLGNENRF